jgi:hypothetical protein
MVSTCSYAEVMLYRHASAAKYVATSGQCALSFATAVAEKQMLFRQHGRGRRRRRA